MRTSIKKSIFIGLSFTVSLFILNIQKISPAQEQDQDIVALKTFVSHDGVHAGGIFKVALAAEIVPNWHIHGPNPADMFLIPSKLMFEEKEMINILQIHYPEPELKKYEYSDEDLSVYLDKVIFGILVEVNKDMPLGVHELIGKFQYQACDHRSCLPPKTIEFKAAFKVVPETQDVIEMHQDIFSLIVFEEKKK